jgi:hypothetical protein
MSANSHKKYLLNYNMVFKTFKEKLERILKFRKLGYLEHTQTSINRKREKYNCPNKKQEKTKLIGDNLGYHRDFGDTYVRAR